MLYESTINSEMEPEFAACEILADVVTSDLVGVAQRMEGDRIYCLKGPSISHHPRQRCISIIYGGSDESLENTSCPLKRAAGLGTPVSPSR